MKVSGIHWISSEIWPHACGEETSLGAQSLPHGQIQKPQGKMANAIWTGALKSFLCIRFNRTYKSGTGRVRVHGSVSTVSASFCQVWASRINTDGPAQPRQQTCAVCNGRVQAELWKFFLKTIHESWSFSCTGKRAWKGRPPASNLIQPQLGRAGSC